MKSPYVEKDVFSDLPANELRFFLSSQRRSEQRKGQRRELDAAGRFRNYKDWKNSFGLLDRIFMVSDEHYFASLSQSRCQSKTALCKFYV